MMSKTNRLLRVLPVCVLFGLVLSACAGAPVVTPSLPPTTAPSGGMIQGVVYNDLNQNGQIDPGEKPLEGVTVSESGCGSDQTVVTAADGVFAFSGLTTSSSCTLLAIRSGWTFSGSYPSLGYPLVVPLAAGKTTVISVYLAPSQAGGGLLATPTLMPTPAPTETPLVTTGPAFTSTPSVNLSQSAPTLSAVNMNLNCYYGPGGNYDSVGVLVKALPVPIEASSTDGTWWEIKNPWNPTTSCWVNGSYTQISGDTSQLPKVNAPAGLVTKVRVSATPIIHLASCSSQYDETITGTISTNGPAFVVYHWEIESPGGLNNHALPGQTLSFAYNTTVTVTQDFNRNCGSFVGLLVIDSPNSKTAQTSWEIKSP